MSGREPTERSPESGAVVAAAGGPDATRGADVPPPPERAEQLVTWQLIGQARACQVMGSPLYAHLLATAAQDVLGGGPVADVLVPRVRPGRGDAAALRLMAAVHRLVLSRDAPRLAVHYPSVGGTVDLATVGGVFLDTIAANVDRLAEDVERPCQTNEVGRTAGLLVGFLEVAARTGKPLALREIGASGGLNLRVDRFRFELPGDTTVGDPDGEPVLRGRWTGPVPNLDARFEIVDRRGCDVAPVDATSEEGRLALTSSVWADQTHRFELLGAALRTAAAVPAVVDRAPASRWVGEHARPRAGRATVVYHSIVEEYLPADERAALHAAIDDLATEATEDAPFAWLRMEPSSELRHHAVTLQLWPHAPEARHLATTSAHGDDVTPV